MYACGGIMEPVAVWVRKGGEWAIIHRCKRCGKLSSNRVAADDNPMKLMSLDGRRWTDAVSRSQKQKGRCVGEALCDTAAFYNLLHSSWNNRAFCAIFFKEP